LTYPATRRKTLPYMLKPSEIFALVLRILGVIIFLYGFRYIADFFLGVTGYFTLKYTEYSYYVILGMGHLLIGMYLTRGAAAVVDYAYPNKGQEENKPAAEENETTVNEDGE
jgi:hypothetical protein